MPKHEPVARGTGLRPEQTAAAENFYRKGEASRYHDNARMAAQQRHLADRALQLLDLPHGVPALLLDAGCGTGFSARPLERAGHAWIGTDISINMLQAACADAPKPVVCDDLGHGFAFRAGVFDGAISISAVQWLCHKTRPGDEPERRVAKFFKGLRAVLAAGARAVLQLYPEQPEHMEMLRDAALATGFTGGLVVDYPWSERSKKLFLVLIAPARKTLEPPPATSKAHGKGKGKGGHGKGGKGKGKGEARSDGGGKGRAKKRRREE
jgi:18S rRNA (guanine1575-N7)-methyltransferase